MTNTDLIKQLRALTQAGMKDCREALEEAQGDLQKAVDIVKIKGLNIADGRTGLAATDGRIAIANDDGTAVMVEVNTATDFTANNDIVIDFVEKVADGLYETAIANQEFDVDTFEDDRKGVVALIKENVVIRRWAVEQSMEPSVRVFSYLHTNNKIGVVMSMKAPSVRQTQAKEFIELGNDLTMQIAAMNPLAVSPDRISPDDLARQKAIFETQLKEEGKPPAMWDKIMIGKLKKYFQEVCLLDQASIIKPKLTIKNVIDDIATRLRGSILISNFVRYQVGNGIPKPESSFKEEVIKLITDV